jgi:hypothetical protein
LGTKVKVMLAAVVTVTYDIDIAKLAVYRYVSGAMYMVKENELKFPKRGALASPE